MHDYFHTFYFNGHFLYELGAVIAQPPTHITSMRDINFESIPGRSGDSIVDNGRYTNKTLRFPIRAVPAFCSLSLQEFKYELTEWLQADDYTYKEYRDTYNPGYFRKGIVTEIEQTVAVKYDVYETAITFNFAPFLYNDNGLNKVVYNSTKNAVDAVDEVEATLENPEMWDSEPVIRIIGNGSFSCLIGDVTFGINNVVDEITIDKPNENVYDKDGVPCNDKITAIKLPSLLSGTNVIRVIGVGDTEFTLEIIPNWRRL